MKRGAASRLQRWSLVGCLWIVLVAAGAVADTFQVLQVGPKVPTGQWPVAFDGSNLPNTPNGAYAMRGWMRATGTEYTQKQTAFLGSYNHNEHPRSEIGGLTAWAYHGPLAQGLSVGADAEVFIHPNASGLGAAFVGSVHSGRDGVGRGLMLNSFPQLGEDYDGAWIALGEHKAGTALHIEGVAGWTDYITALDPTGTTRFNTYADAGWTKTQWMAGGRQWAIVVDPQGGLQIQDDQDSYPSLRMTPQGEVRFLGATGQCVQIDFTAAALRKC